MFKNAIVYSVTPGYRIDADLLSRRPARPCSALETRTDGFAAPRDGDLVHLVGGHQLICWETEDKILPGSVVAEATASRIEQIEEEQDRKVGRKEARDIKERVIEELLPKAFVQHRRTLAILTKRYFVINTSSHARAEDMVSAMLKVFDGVIGFRPLQTTASPTSAMTGWVASGESPEGFSIDDNLELRAATNGQAAIRYTNHTIEGQEVRDHIAAGKVATRLGMTWMDRISFVVDDKLHVKRIRLLDLLTEQAEQQAAEGDQFDADVLLFTGEFDKLMDDLTLAMGGVAKLEGDLIGGHDGN